MATDLAEEIRELIGTGARPITLSEITACAHTAPVPSLRPASPAANAIPGPPWRHHG